MSNKLYIGNLSWQMSDQELRDFFAQYGEVEDAFILRDRATGRSKGFGFVTFVNEDDAKKALEATNGQDLAGRKLNVDFARPPQKD